MCYPAHMESDSRPVAGVDYPRTFQEMEQWFRDEAACRDYIRHLRWPDGFICPHCDVSGEPWMMSDELLRCRAHEAMPRVHTVASLLKRWLLGTLQGGIQHQHLDYYLDEFTVRFNRRRSRARGLLFHRLAEQAVAVPPATYRAITRNPPNPGHYRG
jgi:hypothetical protein